MGIFLKSEKRLAPTFGEPPIAPYPGAAIFGGRFGASSGSSSGALAVPTVWACVGLLSNAVSMLPLETFRKTAGIPDRIVDPQVVSEPAAGMTQSEWLHMVMVSLLMRGNAYGEVVTRDRMSMPQQVELRDPDTVRMDYDRDTGQPVYVVSSGGNQRRVPAENMWHVRGLTLPGQRVGLSPIGYAAATLGIDTSSRKFASDFFADGAHPSSVLETAQPVTQDQALTIKERFRAAVSGREPVVLGAGLTYKPIQVTPEESQFLATQQANVAQIARFFWVPPEMVGGSGGNSMTYANVEQRSLDFLTYAVSFWLKRIEDAVFTLLPAPEFVRFNTAALLRTDAETQAKVDLQHLAAKTTTPTELRARDGRPALTPEQMAEIDMVPLKFSASGVPVINTAPAPTEGAPANG